MNPDSKDTTVGEIMDFLRVGQFQIGFGSYFEMKWATKWHIRTLWRHSHLRGSGGRHPLPSRPLPKAVCQRPALRKALASAYTFRPIHAVIIPVMIPLPSVLLLEVCLLQPSLSKQFPPFPILQISHLTQRICLLVGYQKVAYWAQPHFLNTQKLWEKNMVVFSLHVSFPSCPMGSTGFMQSFRLSVVLCLILLLVSRDLLSCFPHCWCWPTDAVTGTHCICMAY